MPRVHTNLNFTQTAIEHSIFTSLLFRRFIMSIWAVAHISAWRQQSQQDLGTQWLLRCSTCHFCLSSTILCCCIYVLHFFVHRFQFSCCSICIMDWGSWFATKFWFLEPVMLFVLRKINIFFGFKNPWISRISCCTPYVESKRAYNLEVSNVTQFTMNKITENRQRWLK